MDMFGGGFGNPIADFISVVFFMMLCVFGIIVFIALVVARGFKIDPRGRTFTPRPQVHNHPTDTLHSHTIHGMPIDNSELSPQSFEAHPSHPQSDPHAHHTNHHGHHHHTAHDASASFTPSTQDFGSSATPSSIDLGVFTDNSFSSSTDFGSSSFSSSIDTGSSTSSTDTSSSSSF